MDAVVFTPVAFLPPQVVERLLSIPTRYWSQFACAEDASLAGAAPPATPDQKGKAARATGRRRRMKDEQVLSPRMC